MRTKSNMARGVVAVALVSLVTALAAPQARAEEPGRNWSTTETPRETTNPPTAPTGASPTGTTSSRDGQLSPRLKHLAGPGFAGSSTSSDPQSPAVAGDLNLPASGPGSVITRPNGNILVQLRLRDASEATQTAIKATGATFVALSERDLAATIEIAPQQLGALQGVPSVIYATEELTPATGGICPTNIVSEGDAMLTANTARTNFGVDGSGVRVGVLSDSYDLASAPATNAATDVTQGDLPGATNNCGFTSNVTVQSEDASPPGIDEGRAMIQIVHDLAPGATKSFASANNGEIDFANQIRNLATNGSKVIVDDYTYFAEPMYQDGFIAQAVNEVTASGHPYFTDAGNENVIIGGQNVGSYETQAMRAMPCPASVQAFGDLTCHDFDPGVGTDVGDRFNISAGGNMFLIMDWNEPQNGVTTDLDLFLLDASDNVVASSIADNITSGRPFEIFNKSITTTGNYRMVVGKFAGAALPRFKAVMWRPGGLNSVQWTTAAGGDTMGPTTFGHNAGINSVTTAAIPFNNANTLETYSSRGPAEYCWSPVVNALPSPALTPCQTTTVDVSATDGVANSFFGQNFGGTWRFFGTSASAPHAAAIAALQLQKSPCRTVAEIVAAQKSTAHAIGAFNEDAMGGGRLDANAALAATAPCGPVIPAVGPFNVQEGDVVTMDWTGVASVPAGHTLSATLNQTGGPAPFFYQSPTSTSRRFIAPRTASAAGSVLTFDLKIDDLTNGGSTTQPVTVNVGNIVPTGNAGDQKTVVVNAPVTLKGASVDPIEPDTAPAGTVGRQYNWSQTGGPAVTLTPGAGAAFRNATFTPTVAGIYTFSLSVIDHGGAGAASAAQSATVDARSVPAAGSLNGVVRNNLGAALPGVTVDIFAGSCCGGAPVATVATNGSGQWTATGLPGGPLYPRFSLAAHGTRYVSDTGDPTLAKSVTAPSAVVDAVLTPVASLRQVSGTVTNSGLGAVSGASARLYDKDGVVAVTTTNGSGGYTFTGVTPKAGYRVMLGFSHPTLTMAFATTDGTGAPSGSTGVPALSFDATGGNVAVPSTILYNSTLETRQIQATVQTAAATPIPGAEVRVYDQNGFVASTKTNVAGVYTVKGLRPGGNYKVWVWTKCPVGCSAGAFTSAWHTAAPGEQFDQSGKLSDLVDLSAGNQSFVMTLS